MEKARLLQASVWAQCLYGMEGHVLPAHDIRSLRTLASVALIGPNAAASPYLVLATVTTKVQDPQLCCLEPQLRALRRMWSFDPGVAASIQPSRRRCASLGTCRPDAHVCLELLMRMAWAYHIMWPQKLLIAMVSKQSSCLAPCSRRLP